MRPLGKRGRLRGEESRKLSRLEREKGITPQV
uniref:Uncharacterized protein n=1 Tax=Anguilla anguilla TaxID=7936 RepID=A0A0E9T1T8_ANGAN